MKTLTLLLILVSVPIFAQEADTLDLKPTGMNPLYEPNRNKGVNYYERKYWGVDDPLMDRLMKKIEEWNQSDKKRKIK